MIHQPSTTSAQAKELGIVGQYTGIILTLWHLLQNALGIVLAGALGGYVVLQGKDKVKLEEDYTVKLRSEQQVVNSLEKEVNFAIFVGSNS